MTKLRMCCPECEGDSITFPSFSSWNFEKQEWVSDELSDDGDGYCADCDDNISSYDVVEVEE